MTDRNISRQSSEVHGMNLPPIEPIDIIHLSTFDIGSSDDNEFGASPTPSHSCSYRKFSKMRQHPHRTMYTIILIALFSILIIFSSCSSYRNVLYMETFPDEKIKEPFPNYAPVTSLTDKNEPPAAVTMSKMSSSWSSAVFAADTLECRSSVIEFVINATDVKDECVGLRKAFDETCSNENQVSSSSKDGEDSEEEKSNGRRRLRELEGRHRWWWRIVTTKLHSTFNDHIFKGNVYGGGRRSLLESMPELVNNASSVIISSNTSVKENIEKHVVLSPSLPTSSEHVGDQMLTNAITINDEAIVEVMKHLNANLTNTTLLSKTDGELSSEAISVATAAVSAVLNSPESIEARKCCASIMKVFHDECDLPDDDSYDDKKLIIIVCVIALCGIVKSMIRHYKLRWLPEAGGCILVGGKGLVFRNVILIIFF